MSFCPPNDIFGCFWLFLVFSVKNRRKWLIESQMSLLNFNFPEYVLTAESILGELNVIRARCMQRMKVSEKDLSEFNERNQKVEDTQINDPELLNKLNEFDSYNSVLQEAKEKLKT